jgi:hypothetical protein
MTDLTTKVTKDTKKNFGLGISDRGFLNFVLPVTFVVNLFPFSPTSAVNILFLRELRALRGESSSFLCELRVSVVNKLFLRELRDLRGESPLLCELFASAVNIRGLK